MPTLALLRANLWQASFACIDRLPRRKPKKLLPEHLLTGARGEELALFYLMRQGFVVVAHGWQSSRARGDLDLVAWDNDTLCFVEVKTRADQSFATAESAVDRSKRRTLRRLARHYLRQLPEGTETRFDIVSVYLKAREPKKQASYEHFRNAFGWEEINPR